MLWKNSSNQLEECIQENGCHLEHTIFAQNNLSSLKLHVLFFVIKVNKVTICVKWVIHFARLCISKSWRPYKLKLSFFNSLQLLPIYNTNIFSSVSKKTWKNHFFSFNS